MRLILVYACMLVIFTQCCSWSNHDTGINHEQPRPAYDRFIGLAITEIEDKFGNPKYSQKRLSGEITSPLDYEIRSRLGKYEKLIVYYYARDNDYLFFWFVRNSGNKWVVAGDVTQPNSVVF